MRELSRLDIEDIARGSAVLASGGGGDPYLGTLATLNEFDTGSAPTLLDPGELSDDALVVSPALCGAPLPFIEKLTAGRELETAYRGMISALGRPVDAFVAIECGGVNALAPILLSCRLGIPVVDADWMGRAYPTLDLVTLTLHDLPVAPTTVADEHGNCVLINGSTNHWTERLCRVATVEYGSVAAQCTAPVTGAQLRAAAILGSVSRAQTIGVALREAARDKKDPIPELLRVSGGVELYRGKIADVVHRNVNGSTFGEVVIEPFGVATGGRLTIRFRNENLVAELSNGEVIATVPDIITVIDAETGQAITTERLRYGFRVVVVGVPIDAKWRSPEGVELGGPRHFGYDIDYRPVEELVRSRAGRTAAQSASSTAAGSP